MLDYFAERKFQLLGYSLLAFFGWQIFAMNFLEQPGSWEPRLVSMLLLIIPGLILGFIFLAEKKLNGRLNQIASVEGSKSGNQEFVDLEKKLWKLARKGKNAEAIRSQLNVSRSEMGGLVNEIERKLAG